MAITAQDFINKASREIYIPGFNLGDEEIAVQVRSINIVAMITRKAIPNPLMPAVEQLFKLGASGDVAKAEATAAENINELMEFLAFICDKVMLAPTFAEVGDYLTQEQMMAVFTSTQGTVNSLNTFRKE